MAPGRRPSPQPLPSRVAAACAVTSRREPAHAGAQVGPGVLDADRWTPENEESP